MAWASHPQFKFQMGNVWDNMRIKKEGAFIWVIWHKAIAVNLWRARLITDVDDKCHMCACDIMETFVECTHILGLYDC